MVYNPSFRVVVDKQEVVVRFRRDAVDLGALEQSSFLESLLRSGHRFYVSELVLDEADTPHVALALELDALLWTGDKQLKDGLRRKGFDRFYEPSSRHPA